MLKTPHQIQSDLQWFKDNANKIYRVREPMVGEVSDDRMGQIERLWEAISKDRHENEKIPLKTVVVPLGESRVLRFPALWYYGYIYVVRDDQIQEVTQSFIEGLLYCIEYKLSCP